MFYSLCIRGKIIITNTCSRFALATALRAGGAVRRETEMVISGARVTRKQTRIKSNFSRSARNRIKSNQIFRAPREIESNQIKFLALRAKSKQIKSNRIQIKLI